MTKILWPKLGLPFGKKGRRVKDMNSLMGKANVNEEYRQAFRTKSYIEMCDKVQGQLEISINFGELYSSSLTSSPTRHKHEVHLFELEPRQETLISIIEGSHTHQYLDICFEISLEATRICESLLKKVQQMRVNHLSIKNVIRLTETVPDISSWTHNEYRSVYNNFVTFVLNTNPFSSVSPKKFDQLHDSHVLLLQELTSKCKKTKRTTKFIRYVKRALASFLGFGSGALAIVLLVLAMHITIGVVVVTPGLVFFTLSLFIIKKISRAKRKSQKSWCEGEQLDVAARGVYIMINDFDTISRLVYRLNNEMEHREFIADICVRKWKNEMVKEVVKEFQMQESCFVEQLEELEKQIYLCFLNIDRSRRLVVQDMEKY